MKSGVFRPGWTQWTIIMAVVVVVIPVVAMLVVPGGIPGWWTRWFELPRLERTLGFKTTYVRLPPTSHRDYPVFVIVHVVKGSPFDQAGVRPGDIPMGYYHGGEREFLSALSWGRARGFAKLSLTSLEAASAGNWDSPREVTVMFPTPAP